MLVHFINVHVTGLVVQQDCGALQYEAMASSSISLWVSPRVQNMAVSISLQVCHASFLPLVANDETISQAWNTGRAVALSGPI